MGALAVEQVAQRLETSLDVLRGGSRTAAARQRTLRATLDWSHDLLSEDEALFRRLSVFAGGWTLEAAAVCSGGSVEQEDVLDLLGTLVDKSLVVVGATSSGALRYGMLEPIRQYAKELLEQGGQAEVVKGQHGAFFLALAEEAEPELAGTTQGVWAERLEAEHDNMREVLSWLLEHEEGETALLLGGPVAILERQGPPERGDQMARASARGRRPGGIAGTGEGARGDGMAGSVPGRVSASERNIR